MQERVRKDVTDGVHGFAKNVKPANPYVIVPFFKVPVITAKVVPYVVVLGKRISCY